MIRNQHYTTTITLPLTGIELDIEVDFDFRPGCDAQTYGPAEHCYPAEPAEVEINKICGTGTQTDISGYLTAEVLELIETRIQENIAEWMPETPESDYD